ncbi:MAG: tRNA 2-thiouridine(34) synthase MnmA [Candidatus Magasanikbacteria bacterium RIFCSPHIGHO2_02_FULL_51_14]|uniref:tRNA-specific 2-thiouridylase MnmA n=1 Tax=Candidatus Magasanikbacteria bacterium RIFCSPHIGHO2_02_FULL_51_14 TaxID=1798683 RepID=A0A1F6MEF1_9BACT|nr:MAG: tRNA 2-thiouridine(34) synthase MnmA [Candidatus Magasanikbacteria bacterium RIFCSPHIGHO2_02_FULL_51_14]
MNRRSKEKVLVAMSGGVDSSVAAALLLREWYDVTGAYMVNYDPDNRDTDTRMTTDITDMADSRIEKTSALSVISVDPYKSVDPHHGIECWRADYRDALRVAAKLGIPLIKLDFTKEYRESVLEYMFREYEAGRTPNPDVLCNRFVKFGAWLDKAQELGYDKLATGHYARITSDETRNSKLETRVRKNPSIEYPVSSIHLHTAKDKNKDQTYFLHQLSQNQLARVLFPIGDYTKEEVRELARKFDLPTAEKEESMGICFIGEVPIKEFLMQRVSPKSGKIVMTSCEVIGEHEGLAFYTIGQRHMGLQISDFRFQNGETKAAYVVGKDVKKNELVVGYEGDPLLYKKEILVSDVHWIAGRPPEFPLHCEVRLRHRQPLQNAQCSMLNDQLRIKFNDSQRAVTPGQFAVLNNNGECLGGGVII